MASRHFAVGVESTWGTKVAPTVMWEAQSESVQLEREYEDIETLSSFSTSEKALLTESVSGDAEVLATFDGTEMLYDHLIGSKEFNEDLDFDGGAAPGWNTHVFPALTGIPTTDRVGKSLTIQMKRGAGDITWDYLGCKVISLSHAFSADAAARMTVGFLGKTHESQQTPAVLSPFSTFQPMLPKQITVEFDSDVLCARSATVEIENPLDSAFCLGATGLSREPIRTGAIAVSGQVEVLYTDNLQTAKWDNNADVDIKITVEVGGTSNYKLEYRLHKARLSQTTPHMAGRDRLAGTYDFTSLYNSVSTENLEITLTNQTDTLNEGA